MAKEIKIIELLDVALGTPELGCLNLRILHDLLSAMIKHLQIENVIYDLKDTDYAASGGLELSAKLTNVFSDSRLFEDRLVTVEAQLAALNSLPSNEELLRRFYNPSDVEKSSFKSSESRQVSDLWQTVQMHKRVDATEEGISRLTALVDDLILQMTNLQEENRTLSAVVQQMQADTTLKRRISELDEQVAALRKQQERQAELLKDVVHMDAVRGMVFWHTLGTAITGLEYISTARRAPGEKPSFATTFTAGGTKDIGQGDVDLATSPDEELSPVLRKLGTIASGFDKVLERIDRLEELIALKADRTDLESLKILPEMLERIRTLEEITKELLKEKEKVYVDCGTSPHMPFPEDNTKLVKSLQENVVVLQEQINMLNEQLRALRSGVEKAQSDISDLREISDDLDTRKAELTYVDAELFKKADKTSQCDLIGREEFKEINAELRRLIEELYRKLAATDDDLRNLLKALAEGLEIKLDRDELEQLRDWLEKRFKALAAKLKSMQPVSQAPVYQPPDDAAGTRRSLMQHFHCISCDRPLQILVGPEVGPTVYDVYGLPRKCGGLHTTMNAFKRVGRASTGRNARFEDAEYALLPQLSAREQISVEGFDGHLYRGRRTARSTDRGGSVDTIGNQEVFGDEPKLPRLTKTQLTGSPVGSSQQA
ncbi:unnamed protein product [Dicrocoelium dendriticum]|nr:unnamed protein product [Dicrocoelium dendriticum]